MLKIKQIVNVPKSSNCFVIQDKAVGNNCIVIDPGSEDNSLLYQYLEQEQLLPEYIFLTHEHFDHCWGVNDMREVYPDVKLVCSQICSEAIQDKKKNYSVFHQQPGFDLKPADIVLEDVGWMVNWNGYQIRFEPAQGHSAAGIIFFIDKYVFTGDTLIKDIKTVTKLKTASKEKLKESLLMLENEKGKGLIVCPGHGETFELDGYNLELMFTGEVPK